MNMCAHIPFEVSDFISFGCISRSGIAGSFDSVQLFEELPNCFPQDILHSHQP